MQLMSWALARLGSRFSLLFEPYHRRVLHSALGRFLDEPLDLMVGLVEPDGAERVLPFTTRGTPLFNPEQFERFNSVTFRGYSEKYHLRFEFNLHSVFYPQNDELCQLPAFYLEMRVNPAERVRWTKPMGERPETVKLFIRLARPNTQISASANPQDEHARIDLTYQNRLDPVLDPPPTTSAGQSVAVFERIVSLTPGATADPDGRGLTLELPVTAEGSGTKWRLVWGAHCAAPVLHDGAASNSGGGRFRYVRHWKDLDQVMRQAITKRDDYLAHSRRFEKLFEQTTLWAAQRHLICQSFQTFLSNTFWCDLDDGREWFSVWEGSCFFHSTVDVEYNDCLFYLALWPRLLGLQLTEWAAYGAVHEPSGGCILAHDMGAGPHIGKQAYPHAMPVEENSNYLLMLQAYTHWTGDVDLARGQAVFLAQLAKYLIWTDRDASGFPSEGGANTIDDASPATQYARKQTYLAIKRLAALQAAADLLERADQAELAKQCRKIVKQDAPKIEKEAWLGDHFAVCVDRSAAGVLDAWSGAPLPYESMPGWDAYSIYTANGLLLPALSAQPCPLNTDRLRTDLTNATRECLGRYGCGHTSFEVENVWLSQNLWRDFAARYLQAKIPLLTQTYWDMQVMSNTHQQSLGFVDTYINNNLCFYPRGVTSIGCFLAEPRLQIDRLAKDGPRISIEPDTYFPQRWPLLPLIDWKAGKIPVCVVDSRGRVSIEGEIDPIVVRNATPTPPSRAL